MAANLTYEVECELDPGIAADYDAWLPGHVREVLACAGFLDAVLEVPRTGAGAPERRRVRYRLESEAALDAYLESHAPRLRAAVGERFGDRVRCERRILLPRDELTAPAHEPARCLDCGAPVTGKHCAQCGQAADVHVLSMREVVGDVAHSLLHLDSRVWRTLRLLARRPGELTREFIAGRHQRYLPPFRLYLAISILYFALAAVLPGAGLLGEDTQSGDVVARAQIDAATTDAAFCEIDLTDNLAFDELEESLVRACVQMRADGGKRFAERFAATAPKLMFIFLPLMTAVALLFYWRPRRLYAEHLVLFLHNHAFTFLLLGTAEILGAISDVATPFAGVLDFAGLLLFLYLTWYVYRSMRVVYGQGRLITTLKFLGLVAIYFVLLGVTMLAGFVYTLLELA